MSPLSSRCRRAAITRGLAASNRRRQQSNRGPQMKANAVNGLKVLCTIALAATVAACGSMESGGSMHSASPAPSSKTSAHGGDLTAALAAADRPAEDKARDADRKPAELLQFFGVKPGMTTVDIIALGGYITEALSVAVGPNGK